MGTTIYTEDFSSGWTTATSIGTHSDWHSDAAPTVVNNVGVGSGWGVGGGSASFHWTAHNFAWGDYDAFEIRAYFQATASGTFDDDRAGWTITPTNTDSDNHMGVQLEGTTVQTYWDSGSVGSGTGVRNTICTQGAVGNGEWVQLRAKYTYLTSGSCKIEVEVWDLDVSDDPNSILDSGSIADTSDLGGDSAPSGYFGGGSDIAPLYKNFSSSAGNFDNAYVSFFNESKIKEPIMVVW